MRRARAILAALGVLAVGPAGPDPGASPAQAEIFRRYRDNVVAITYVLRPKERPTGGEGRKVEEAICGVILNAEGLIVTSGDPFPDLGGDPRTTLVPGVFKVHRGGGRPMDAEAVGLDREMNLAYLRLTNPPPGLRAVRFRQAARLEVGDDVIVVGVLSKKYDYEPIFYSGLVNAVLHRPRLMYSLDIPLQDLAIGGLVVSGSGEPVGIVGEDLLKEAPSTDRMPANVLSIFGSFTQGRRVGYPMVFPYSVFSAQIASPPPIASERKRSWLGIVMQPLGEDLIEYWGLDVAGGIIISSVVQGSPAEGAGLRPADILIALQGEPLRIHKEEDLAEFRRRIERMGVGRPVDLTFLRGGERTDLTLRLGEAPKTAWTAEEVKDEELGLTVREITIDDLLGQNLDPATRGVVVSELEPAGWAQISGLQVDDIIQSIDGRPVRDLESFRAQTDRLRAERPDGTLMFVLRQTETLFVRVKTPWAGGAAGAVRPQKGVTRWLSGPAPLPIRLACPTARAM